MLPFDPVQRSRYPVGYARAKAHVLEHVLLRSMVRADLVIFVSDHAKKVIQARAGGRIRNATVIPHGVSDDFRHPDPRTPRPAWLPAEEYVLYVSTFEPYKSHREVVQAFALFKALHPGPEKLLFVGRETVRAYADSVRREIDRLRLNRDVILAGSQSHAQLPVIYQYARAGIFASECENCPNILLESMAAGVPMAVSNHAPMPEFAGDAVTYFDPQRPEQLADRLAALLADQGLARTLSTRSKDRSSLYDWRLTAQRTWDSILELSRRGRHGKAVE